MFEVGFYDWKYGAVCGKGEKENEVFGEREREGEGKKASGIGALRRGRGGGRDE